MITTEELQGRVTKAVNSLNQKRKAIGRNIHHTTHSEHDHVQAHVGNILMSVAQNGLQVHPEDFSRSFAMMILAAKDMELAFQDVSGYLMDLEDWAYCTSEADTYSRMRKTQLMAVLAASLASAAERPGYSDREDFGALSLALTDAAYNLIMFCIMHGMNEDELINDIPNDIEIHI